MPAPTIRTATAADRDAVRELLHQLGYAHTPTRVAELLEEIASDPHQRVYLAEHAGRVVGLLDLNLRRQLHHCAYVAQIDSLVVDHSARGLSVGAHLLRHAVEVATAHDADVIEVGSALHRTRALRFYQREGFEFTSRKLVRPLKAGAH